MKRTAGMAAFLSPAGLAAVSAQDSGPLAVAEPDPCGAGSPTTARRPQGPAGFRS